MIIELVVIKIYQVFTKMSYEVTYKTSLYYSIVAGICPSIYVS